jgi:hypothetical protein
MTETKRSPLIAPTKRQPAQVKPVVADTKEKAATEDGASESGVNWPKKAME